MGPEVSLCASSSTPTLSEDLTLEGGGGGLIGWFLKTNPVDELFIELQM